MLIIEVTQDDIDNGECGSPCNCPVARAARRMLVLEEDDIEVSSSYIAYRKDDEMVYLDVPDSVERFVLSYDDGLQVYPFTFEVDAE